LMLPVFALPALLGGEPVSPGLAHAAFLGMGGFVLIVAFSAVLLTTDVVLIKVANALQWLLNKIPRRKARTEGLAQRLREQRDMVRTDLGKRWWQAAILIGGRIGLDYVALDCAETPDGRLLVFEADNAAIVHNMDPVDIYPYKAPQMRKVFDAFVAMLYKHAHREEARAA